MSLYGPDGYPSIVRKRLINLARSVNTYAVAFRAGRDRDVGKPYNVTRPTITGTAQVGQILTANNGTWDNSPTLTRRWLADGVAVGGATGATFTPLVGHVGDVITLEITGVNRKGELVVVSLPTAAVIAA
jgi:hypothetical protein